MENLYIRNTQKIEYEWVKVIHWEYLMWLGHKPCYTLRIYPDMQGYRHIDIFPHDPNYKPHLIFATDSGPITRTELINFLQYLHLPWNQQSNPHPPAKTVNGGNTML